MMEKIGSETIWAKGFSKGHLIDRFFNFLHGNRFDEHLVVSLVTEEGIRLVMFSMSLPLSWSSSWRISKKWWVSSSSISLLVSIRLPSIFLSFFIIELLLFWITELWKNLVFFSPSCNYLTLDFFSSIFPPTFLLPPVGPIEIFLFVACPHPTLPPCTSGWGAQAHLSAFFYLKKCY